MNKKEKEQKESAINIENNSAGYYLILTAITTQIVLKIKLRKTGSRSERWGVL